MNEQILIPIAIVFSIFTTLTYGVLCIEYPRRYLSDPVWVIVLKLWGGLLVFFGSFFVIAWIMIRFLFI